MSNRNVMRGAPPNLAWLSKVGARMFGWQRRFVLGERGAVVVEHALFIAIVMGTMFLSVDAMGEATKHSLERLTGSNLPNMAAGDSRGAESTTRQLVSANPVAAGTELAQGYQASMFDLLVGASILILGAVVWRRLYVRSRQKLISALTQSNPPVVEAHSDSAVFRKRQEIFNILVGNSAAMFESRVLVRHLMSKRVFTIGPNETAETVKQRMQHERIRHLVVCDQQNRLLGVISDRDLSRPGRTAAGMMTREPLTVDADSCINPAVTSLIDRQISCLPVVSSGKLVGVLTTTDVMMALQGMLQALQRWTHGAASRQAAEDEMCGATGSSIDAFEKATASEPSVV